MKNISNTRLAFDTNLWVYLLDEKSSYHKSVDQLFAMVEKNGNEIVVAHQNILEIIKVLIRWYNFTPEQALKRAQKLISTNITQIFPGPKTLEAFFKIAASNLKNANNFDLYLAATLLDNGVTILLTNDKKGFKGIKNLQVFLLDEFISDEKDKLYLLKNTAGLWKTTALKKVK